MPALDNPRHERFAQDLAKGLTLREAFEAAGYSYDPANAARLRRTPKIAVRVAEIQARAAMRAEVTLAGLTQELLRVAADGHALGGSSGLAVARAALMDVAKLNGLVVERSAQAHVRVEDLLAQLDGPREP